MRAKGPIDTGVLLAFLDADDAWHERCVAAFAKLTLPLSTSSVVIAALFQLIGNNPRDVAAWRFLQSGAVTMLPLTDQDLSRLDQLMKRYANRPMDYADATLLHLAERESVSTIFSIDNKNFETYRIGGRKRFAVVPGRS